MHVFAESKDQLNIYQLKKKIEAEVLVSICNSKFSNIRKLSLTFYNCSFSTEIGKILVTIPNLDFVDMSGISGNSKVNSELMKILAQSKTLTGVAISGDKTFDDAALEALIQLQALEYLNVEYCNVPTEGIATVAATHRDTLKYLNIEGDFVITDLVLRELSNLPHLNTLFLPTTVDNAGMLQLSRGNAPLKYLGLRDNSSIDDFVFPTLVNIILQKRIEYINISGSNISHNVEIALHRLRAYAGVLEEGIESNCSEVSIEEDAEEKQMQHYSGYLNDFSAADVIREVQKLEQMRETEAKEPKKAEQKVYASATTLFKIKETNSRPRASEAESQEKKEVFQPR